MKIMAFIKENIRISATVVRQDYEITWIPKGGRRPLTGKPIEKTVKPVFAHFRNMCFPQLFDVLGIGDPEKIRTQAHFEARRTCKASNAMRYP